MTETQRVRLDQLGPGPLIHEKLSDSQVERLRAVYAITGSVDGSARSFEDFELGFLRDIDPEREIQIWEMIAFGLRDYLAEHPEADKELSFAQALQLTVNVDAFNIDTAALAAAMSKYDPKLKKGKP